MATSIAAGSTSGPHPIKDGDQPQPTQNWMHPEFSCHCLEEQEKSIFTSTAQPQTHFLLCSFFFVLSVFGGMTTEHSTSGNATDLVCLVVW